jgi:hypothetical protein
VPEASAFTFVFDGARANGTAARNMPNVARCNGGHDATASKAPNLRNHEIFPARRSGSARAFPAVMTRRVGFASLSLVSLSLLGAGCWQNSYAFPTADDVRMAPSESDAMRSGELAAYGDVYALGMQSAHEVNGWVGEAVEAAGRVLRVLEDLPPSSTDGAWEIYGPYPDHESGLSWMIRVDGNDDESRFEVLVGTSDARKASQMDELLSGEIAIDGKVRKGSFSLSFDTIETYELKAGPERSRTHQGTIVIRFERNTGNEHKVVEIDYDDFEVTQEYPIREYFSAEGYSFRRAADGAGSFHLNIISTFQTQVWSGPERERMLIDLEWNADGAGRGTGQLLHLEDEGDLAHGDIRIDECFAPGGFFTWREINEPYASGLPEYNSGDPASCVSLTDDLPSFSR